MLFHTFEFQLLLIITVFMYYFIPNKRLFILGIANLIFYGVSGFSYLVLFIFVVFITYFCAIRINSKYGKIFYFIGIATNILNIVFFKYTGFLLDNINNVFNIKFLWQDSFLAEIMLPVGISFYTFQLIAYLVDVKRRDIKAEKSFITFWVFISFFGQLIAGPIMRGNSFLPQIHKLKTYKWDALNFKYGMYYIFMGITKKIVFADYLSGLADYYFNQIGNLHSLDAWFAAYLFTFQIYFDFSAYSEIAVGVGYLFGLKLDLNFMTPYISKSPSEFWQRWHITLSSWIRDYIYIPLGGNKNGFKCKCLYLLIAMTISGIWHGAAWTFIIWGIYHGLLSVVHSFYVKYLCNIRKKLKVYKVYNIICVIAFFQMTVIGWVVFRAASIRDALFLIKKMIFLNEVIYSYSYFKYFGFILFLFLIHILEYYLRTNQNKIARIWKERVPIPIRSFAYTMLIIILILFTKAEQNTFIYFQF